MSIAEKITAIAENELRVRDKGIELGKQEQYDSFWDAYQENGNRTHYVGAFNFQGWKESTYNPKYPIIGTAPFGLQQVFSNSQVKDTKVDIVLRGGDNIGALFNGCTYLKRVPSLILETPAINILNTFNNCIQLEEINVSCVNDGCFAASFSMQQCTKLSKASIESIINALSGTTTGLTLTLSDQAVKAAFSDDYPDGYGPEWEAIIMDNLNWTIALA